MYLKFTTLYFPFVIINKMKIILYIVFILLFGCLKTKRSAFDMTKPSGIVGQIVIQNFFSPTTGGNTNSGAASNGSNASPVININGVPTSLKEGTSVTLSINLSTAPNSNVTLNYSVSPTGYLNVNSGSLTFTQTNYATPQNLTFTTLEDDNDVLENSVTLTFQSNIAATQTYNIAIPDNDKRIFLTNTLYNGNLGGVSGADAKCQADANKPSSTQAFKALIAESGADTRSPPNASNVDWVIKPNTYYRRNDGTLLFLSNASGLFTFGNFSNAWSPSVTGLAWTGLNTDWTPNSNQCTSWTNSTSGVNGNYGIVNSSVTSSQIISGGGGTCNSSNYLICVEQ